MTFSCQALAFPFFIIETSSMLLLEAFHVLILRHFGGILSPCSVVQVGLTCK